MWLRRIIWIIMIFISLILYIFSNSPATLTVFVALLVIPAVSFVMLRIFSGKTEFKIEAPRSATKNADVILNCSVKNNGIFPLIGANVTLNGRNVRTGDQSSIYLDAGVVGKKAAEVACVFRSARCGRIELEAGRLQVKDFLGMFKKEQKLDGSSTFTIYPERFAVDVSLSNSASAFSEGDKYSKTQVGNDSSETMGIKEYVPGEPVKNIHWKLSAKTDKLLVREFGQPVIDQVCILLDMSVSERAKAEEIDAVAEVFASVADGLIASDTEPKAGWQDPESGVLNIRSVASAEELGSVLGEMMGVPVKKKGVSISEAIESGREKLGFAHVVAVGVSPELNMAQISNGASATLILPDTGSAGYGLQKDGTSIIVFNMENYRDELAHIEL